MKCTLLSWESHFCLGSLYVLCFHFQTQLEFVLHVYSPVASDDGKNRVYSPDIYEMLFLFTYIWLALTFELMELAIKRRIAFLV